MAEKKVSELPVAASLDGTDLIMVAQENSSSSSDYISMKTTAADIADEFNTELTYSDLNTTDKTIVGSINEVKGMVEANPAGSAPTALTAIKINGVNYKIEDTGSIVRAFQVLNTGSEIGSVTVDNQETKFYVGNLNNLGDVTLTSPTEGQVLKYDSTNNVWINGNGGSSVGDLDDLGDVTLTTPTDGQVLKYDGTNQIWVNAAESGGGSSTLAGLTDTNISSPAADQDLSYDSTSSKWINKTHRVELTKAQYDALPSSKLTDGIEYFITDMETTGTEIIANPQETATGTLTKLQIGDDIYNISGGGSASWTDVTGTLTAGQTEITLNNSAIHEDSTFDFYTSKFGVNPSNVELTIQKIKTLRQELVTQESELDVTVTANTSWSGYEPWKAFLSNGSGWVGGGGNPHWLQVEFDSVTSIREMDFISIDSSRSHAISRVEYSNNGVYFEECGILESTMINDVGHCELNNDYEAKYFRIYFDGSYGQSYYPCMSQLEIYGYDEDPQGQKSITLTFDALSTDLGDKVRVTNEIN